MDFKKGDRWINFMGDELRVIGIIENIIVLRYKGAHPFVKLTSEMPEFLKFIKAIKI